MTKKTQIYFIAKKPLPFILLGYKCINKCFGPTILRVGPYRFYFYSHEPNEPPLVHVDREGFSAKFWLQKVSLAKNLGFQKKELNTLQELVIDHQKQFLDKWYGYFG